MPEMTTTQPLLGTATPLCGIPHTEDGLDMPYAHLYELSPPMNVRTTIVVVASTGVYEANLDGSVHDFFKCLYERPAVDTPANALRAIGYELVRGTDGADRLSGSDAGFVGSTSAFDAISIP
ncbi:hypothetical protein ACQP1G_17000 [Nocardia sp. CA-107356]|uniref:hypothetical protein n=1 Tax=Nocardia sp. CA-107356 TaxID=3239972 RepID=UPI003D8B34F6